MLRQDSQRPWVGGGLGHGEPAGRPGHVKDQTQPGHGSGGECQLAGLGNQAGPGEMVGQQFGERIQACSGRPVAEQRGRQGVVAGGPNDLGEVSRPGGGRPAQIEDLGTDLTGVRGTRGVRGDSP